MRRLVISVKDKLAQNVEMSYARSRSPRYMRSGILRSASASRYAYDRSRSPRILPRSDLYDLTHDEAVALFDNGADYVLERGLSLDRRSLSRHRSLVREPEERIREYVVILMQFFMQVADSAVGSTSRSISPMVSSSALHLTQ